MTEPTPEADWNAAAMRAAEQIRLCPTNQSPIELRLLYAAIIVREHATLRKRLETSERERKWLRAVGGIHESWSIVESDGDSLLIETPTKDRRRYWTTDCADLRERLEAAERELAAFKEIGPLLREQLAAANRRAEELQAAIKKHWEQKADDRCWIDDLELYKAAGLPPHDPRVGDKAAMMVNCARFIEKRCEGGGWASYAELEAERDRLKAECERLERRVQYAGLSHGEDDVEQLRQQVEELREAATKVVQYGYAAGFVREQAEQELKAVLAKGA